MRGTPDAVVDAVKAHTAVAADLTAARLSRKASRARHCQRMRQHQRDEAFLRQLRRAGVQFGDVMAFGDGFRTKPASRTTGIRTPALRLRQVMARWCRVVLTDEHRYGT